MKLRRMLSVTILVLCGVLLLALVATFAVSTTAPRPANLGLGDNQLAEVPDSPNCVSTQTASSQHRMSPMSFPPGLADVTACLQRIVEAMPGATVVRAEEGYLYVEFRSRIFRFVDDVEFAVDRTAGEVHFRSASRTGHTDFGVNRKRMEQITSEFERIAQQEQTVPTDADLPTRLDK